MLFYVFYFALRQHTKSRPTYSQQYKQLFTYQDTSSVLKKITEDILHKIYTEKGAVIMISFIHSESEKFTDTGFLGTSQLMLEEVASYIWAHSSSLIKNLTPFEHDAEICSFSVIMESICKQPDDTFIQMASPKIDFYFQVFKHSKTTF